MLFLFGSLDLINERSEKERELGLAVESKLEKGFLDVLAVYLANVDPTVTNAGKALLTTQTDREIASERIATYEQQKAAEETRKSLVAAQTTADTEKQLVEAQRSIEINRERGQAQLVLAEFERKAYAEIIEALGVDFAGRMELIKLAAPNVYLETDPSTAIAGAIFASKK